MTIDDPISTGPVRPILYIDDDPLDLESLEQGIDRRRLPLMLFTASTLEQGRELLHECGAEVVLVDNGLGQERGIELLRSAPGVPMIVMTGAGSERLAVEALRRGAADYVVKRADGSHVDHVLGSVMAVLARRDSERAQARLVEQQAHSYRELEEFAQTLEESMFEPLERIVGKSSMLLEDCAGERTLNSDRAAPRLRAIADDGRRVLQIVRRLSRLAALNPAAEQPCRMDFGDIVRRAVRRVELENADQLDVRIESTHTLRVRPIQLQVAIEALLENALEEAETGGGRLAMVASCEVEGDVADLQFLDAERSMELVDRRGVFSIYRASAPQAGPGLAIVERVARIHGGRAWVDDGIDGNACFHIQVAN